MKGNSNTLPDKHTLRKIYDQHIHTPKIRSFLEGRKITPDGCMKVHEGMNRIGEGKYIGQFKKYIDGLKQQ